MPVIQEIENKWTLRLPTLHVALRKDSPIVIDASVLNRARDADCRLVAWRYRIQGQGNGAAADLELFVQEKSPNAVRTQLTRLANWLSKRYPNWQFFTACMLALATLGSLAALAWTWYLQPDGAWAFAGRHARATVGWAIVVLTFLVVAKLLSSKRNQTFAEMFFSESVIILGFVLLGLWLNFSALPQHFAGSDAEYASYAKVLAARFASSYWPLIVATLPWLSVGLKLFGSDFSEKLDAVGELAGSHQHPPKSAETSA